MVGNGEGGFVCPFAVIKYYKVRKHEVPMGATLEDGEMERK